VNLGSGYMLYFMTSLCFTAARALGDVRRATRNDEPPHQQQRRQQQQQQQQQQQRQQHQQHL